MKFDNFIIPETLEEALGELKKESSFPIAGGTAFQYLPDRPGQTAVDITRLGFKGIQREGNHFIIGANTTLTDLIRFNDQGWVLHEVATQIPTHQIRNISTVGGSIARVFPWSDIPPALMVLEATVNVIGEKEQSYEANVFFEKQPSQLLQNTSLVTSIAVPAVGIDSGFVYKKLKITNSAFSLMSVAVIVELENHKFKTIRLAISGGTPAPSRLPEVENQLHGREVNMDLSDVLQKGTQNVAWKGKEGLSDTYAKHLGEVLIKDGIKEAVSRIQNPGENV